MGNHQMAVFYVRTSNFMDMLAEALQSFQLHSTVLYRGTFGAPWGVEFSPKSKEHCDASFHCVLTGQSFLHVEGTAATALALKAGDFVVIPHGTTHSLRDALSTPVRPIEQTRPSSSNNPSEGLRYGGDGAETTLLCGTFSFRDGSTNPLVRSLPPLIHVNAESGREVRWLEPTLGFLACEANNDRPGAQTVINRLCDILFIQAIRFYLSEIPPCTRGWFRAMQDEQIGAALHTLHSQPELPWSVGELANRAFLSRSSFSARFTELMGEPPMQYVTRWRIHIAGALLRDSDLPLREIATRVGYESEAAFSKAFKRQLGIAPGAYRASRLSST